MIDEDLLLSHELALVEERMVGRYRDRIPEERVRRAVREAFASFAAAPVRCFVSLLAERAARAHLEACLPEVRQASLEHLAHID